MKKRLTLNVWQDDSDDACIYLLDETGDPTREVYKPDIGEYERPDGTSELRSYPDNAFTQEFYEVPEYAVIGTNGLCSPDFEDLRFCFGPSYDPHGLLEPCGTERLIREGWGPNGYRNPCWGIDCEGVDQMAAVMDELSWVEIDADATPDKILGAVARAIGAYPRDSDDWDDE